MKNLLVCIILVMACNFGFSQELIYDVKGKHSKGISKEKLLVARSISDIRPGYPSSWITTYLFTEISVRTNGELLKASGINETLSPMQLSLLKKAEVGDEISFHVEYTYFNPVTQFPDLHTMRFVETVVPEIEAEYPGGYDQLLTYLKNAVIDKIPMDIGMELKPLVINFTVSEKGEVTNAHITTSSAFPAIDKIMLRAISGMPVWKPAENGKGLKIPQEFEFRLGNSGC